MLSFFPHTEATVYLYDLTNTYLEGHGPGNALAERGHCKSKRYDCPLADDIESFRNSIQKGTIKNQEKIENKFQRILGKHGRLAKDYAISLEKTQGKATGISMTRKTAEVEPLYGCYVIETSHLDMPAEEIWKLYMTLTRVESAFRSMKEDLGMRPVYHQTEERTAAHLFITVLAYHLLATIENLLTRQGDTRTWGTLRVMSTLMRGTVSMQDDQHSTYNIRLSGEPSTRAPEYT